MWWILYIVFIVVIVCVVRLTTLQRLQQELPRMKSKFRVRFKHSWYATEFYDRPSYCNCCEGIMGDGLCCEVCNYRVHLGCVSKVAENCKMSAVSATGLSSPTLSLTQQHQWLRGNLELDSVCCVCSTLCGNEPRLVDFRCVWCQRTVHESCFPKLDLPECDLGELRDMIIPPNCIVPITKGWRKTIKWTINFLPEKSKLSPLLVFINPKSGGNEGKRLERKLKSLLNPFQVVNVMQKGGPDPLLESIRAVSSQCRILVCGGDGTVGWVLSAIDKILQNNAIPPVGIIPLGTGNDLAQSLGWGHGYDGEDLVEILHELHKAEVVLLDRWKITIQNTQLFPTIRHTSEHIMNNYFSIGSDSQVALNFHLNRNKYPHWYSNRLINKLWYGIFGAKDALERTCKDLHKIVEIELDGTKLDISELQGIIILNIPSYAGGVDLWGQRGTSFMSDQRLETVGIFSSLHVGQVMIGISDTVKLGQGKSLKIQWKQGHIPIQIDGEPWAQAPCSITITFFAQSRMLKKKDPELTEQHLHFENPLDQ